MIREYEVYKAEFNERPEVTAMTLPPMTWCDRVQMDGKTSYGYHREAAEKHLARYREHNKLAVFTILGIKGPTGGGTQGIRFYVNDYSNGKFHLMDATD